MDKFDSPSYCDTALEGVRTGTEMMNSAFGFARDFIMPQSDVYRGPVMAIPGFMAHDMTTYALRTSLRPEGYQPYDSDTGLNLGVIGGIATRQQNQLDKIFEEHDGEPVALVGHSLGGIQSLLLAYRNPDKVRSVTTLGTPLGAAMDKSGVNLLVEGAFVLLNQSDRDIQAELKEYMENGPPDVPLLSVYSAYDGVVAVDSAQNPWAGQYSDVENIEVDPKSKQSHMGMVCSTDVLSIVKAHLDQYSEAVPVVDHELALT